MPYTNIPQSLWGKMDDCVDSVQKEQGVSKERAVAICYGSVVESESAHHTMEATLGSPKDKEGKVWDVTLIGASEKSPLVEADGARYIRSSNGRLYELDAISESTPQWDGVKAFDNHLTDSEFEERGGMRSVKNEAVAVFKSPYWDEKRHCLNAEMRVIDDDMRKKLLNAYELGVLENLGLSIDTIYREGRPVRVDGKMLPTVVGFENILSVDVVASPAAGGRFNRVIASEQIIKEADMPEYLTREEAEKMIAEAIAARSSEQAPEVDAEEAAAVVEEAAAMAASEVPPEADPAEAAQAVADEAQAAADAVAQAVEEPAMEAMQQRLRVLECQLTLNAALDAAKLPTELRRVVEASYNGKIFEKGALMETIKRAKEAQTAGDNSGQARGAGTQRAQFAAVLSPRDKAEIGFMQLFNGRSYRALESNSTDYVQDRLPDSYKSWIREGRGKYAARNLSSWLYDFVDNPLAMRASEANDVSSITKNALNVFLAAEYSAKQEWWAPIVSEEEVNDINDATLVRDYGFENLDIVDEGAAYDVINLSDDEETASFVKHGNYVGVTLETMLKDKLGVLRRIPTKLANSWYNTLGAKVAAVFTTNTATGPVLGDTGALFNSTAVTTAGGHANLGSTALSYTTWDAAVTAMMKQTDKKLGTGNRLLIRPRYLLVPVDLRAAGLAIRNSEMKPGSANNDVNPYYQGFEVVEVPQFSDTDNWAAVADPMQFPAIWLIYVAGYRVPQIITAGDESGGAVFTNDTWRYKVRLMTYRFSSTYDCAPVADFRPLYKANV